MDLGWCSDCLGFHTVPLEEGVSVVFVAEGNLPELWCPEERQWQPSPYACIAIYSPAFLQRGTFVKKFYHLLREKAHPCPCMWNWCMLLLSLIPSVSWTSSPLSSCLGPKASRMESLLDGGPVPEWPLWRQPLNRPQTATRNKPLRLGIGEDVVYSE